MYIVYKATNVVNGKIYIGATNNLKRRINEHKNHAIKDKSRFHDAILKYGIECFVFDIMFECERKEDAFRKEKDLIEFFNSTESKTGYNETSGGIGGVTHSISGENNPRYGKTYSQEEREYLSSKLKGREVTEESRSKISAKLKGKSKSESHRLNLSKSLKGKTPPNIQEVTVIHVETGEVLTFKSMTEMENHLSCSRKTIKSGRVSKNGYKLYNKESQETIEKVS